MVDARLTHPTRSTLPIRQRQQDEQSAEAEVNIFREVGVDRTTLVHTETREKERTVRGMVTAPRRSRDSGTADWEQALADYADLLESHVDEFQGEGYTFEDDILDIQKRGILESVEWTRTPGRKFDFEYELTFMVGRGTFEEDTITRRNPTVDTSMDVPLRIDGVDLPGFRDVRVSTALGLDPNPVFDRDNAENNDIIIEDGALQRVVFEGTHTGTDSERQTAHDTLDNLLATKNNVTLKTRFPGYDLDGYLVRYGPTQEDRFGTSKNHYTAEFIVGQRA